MARSARPYSPRRPAFVDRRPQGDPRRANALNRIQYAQSLQNQALATGTGYGRTQALSNANAVARRLLGGGGNYYGYGGGGGGYAMSPAQQLFQQWQGALNRANAANEARYQEGKRGWRTLQQGAYGTIAGMGEQERADINRDYQGLASRTHQDMVNRGLAGITTGPLYAGIMREKRGQIGRLNDRLARLKLSAMSTFGQGALGFLERKTERGPRYNDLINLAMKLGSSGYGQGGYGRSLQVGSLYNMNPYAGMTNLLPAFRPQGGGPPPRDPNHPVVPMIGGGIMAGIPFNAPAPQGGPIPFAPGGPWPNLPWQPINRPGNPFGGAMIG